MARLVETTTASWDIEKNIEKIQLNFQENSLLRNNIQMHFSQIHLGKGKFIILWVEVLNASMQCLLRQI